MTVSKSKRRPGRPSRSDQLQVDYDACLDRAIEGFAERGFDGVSLREIAAEAGVSHGLLNARYGTKLGLWTAAVDHGMERLRRRMIESQAQWAPDADLEQQVLATCIDFLEAVADFPAIVQLINSEGARGGERLDHITETFMRGRIWPLTTLLQEGRAKGIFRNVPVMIPFTLVAHGAGALVALRPMMDTLGSRLGSEPDSRSQMIAMAAEIIVRGLKA